MKTENLILSPDPKQFIYNYNQITVDSIFCMPETKPNTSNLWVIKFTSVNWKTSIQGKIYHRTNKPLNYNLSIVRGLIIHELKQL